MSEEFRTEIEFRLPRGFIGEDGTLHREGVMRTANAADEILPQADPRVRQNEAYLMVILLARVITRLGALTHITTNVVERLSARDFAYLQELYYRFNREGANSVHVQCPHCEREFDVELTPPGES
jgi:hypothetical protein